MIWDKLLYCINQMWAQVFRFSLDSYKFSQYKEIMSRNK